jgi:hypothetical protein
MAQGSKVRLLFVTDLRAASHATIAFEVSIAQDYGCAHKAS